MPGALVSFVDLYKHMEGGQLNASMQMDENTLSGNLEIQNFVLRDEPAIPRLVAQSTELSAPGQNAEAAKRIDGGAVEFKRLKVDFNREGSRLDLHDATMYGPEIGLSVDGWLDYSHDRVAMNGTFVPVFALNNLFAQIPGARRLPRRQVERGTARHHLSDLGHHEFADLEHQSTIGGDPRLPADHLRQYRRRPAARPAGRSLAMSAAGVSASGWRRRSGRTRRAARRPRPPLSP